DLIDISGAVDPNKTENIAIVSEHHIRIAGMSGGRAIAPIVARDIGTRAAKNQIGSITALGCAGQSEEAGIPAYDVILAEVAEDDIVVRIALDVVVAVACALEGGDNHQCARRIAGCSDAAAAAPGHD